MKKTEPKKLMMLGFFVVLFGMLFISAVKGTIWYNVYGVMIVLGAALAIFNFIKMNKK
ncbi:MAG: hypothetical protein U9O94_10630 [Nanoarchaeota archaeon]|nr:hypothetical protein [Nanoarchaeota archaeon]